MPNERSVFAERLEELIELGGIEFRPEPLDASSSGVSRRSGQLGPVRTVVRTASTHSMNLRVAGAVAVTGRLRTRVGVVYAPDHPSKLRVYHGQYLRNDFPIEAGARRVLLYGNKSGSSLTARIGMGLTPTTIPVCLL